MHRCCSIACGNWAANHLERLFQLPQLVCTARSIGLGKPSAWRRACSADFHQPTRGTTMTTIGGNHRKPKLPTQPQFVVQAAAHLNQFAVFDTDDKGHATIAWIGDPNAATTFNSRYAAKLRTREFDNVPETRVFKALERAAAR